MISNHETIFDDTLIQANFSDVAASDQLLPAHWHEHLEIISIREGKMTAYINETSYELIQGDILIVNPRDIHFTHARLDCRYTLLQIPPAHLERISSHWEYLHFSEYLAASRETDSLNFRLSRLLRKMEDIHRENKEGNHLLFLARLYELLYLLYKEDSKTVSPQSLGKTRRDFHRLEQSMEYVRLHFHEDISLSEVAELLSVTPEYFCRLFKKYTGQTFFTYINQVRLMHFYQDLLQTDESITYLLDKNGIRNYKVFLRTFKEAYGTTPNKLRKQ